MWERGKRKEKQTKHKPSCCWITTQVNQTEKKSKPTTIINQFPHEKLCVIYMHFTRLPDVR